MTLEQIKGMLDSIDLPFAYDHFEKAEAPNGPPFICFIYTDRDDFNADNTNYQRVTRMVIELYTDAPDFTLEESVETAMMVAGLVFAKSGPGYIEGERMYITTYNTEVLLTNE